MEAQWERRRRAIIRDALGIGIAVGAYGITFGALATTGGFSVPQTMALSSLMFTGGSQFAYIGVVAAGGSVIAAAVTALLLGARNTLYGVAMAPLLKTRGANSALAAQLTIDESTAMALAHEDPDEPRAARTAFWATGVTVFICWNIATLLGALGASALGDPRSYGLDAVIPAAFLALMWPRLTSRSAIAVAVLAAAMATLLTVWLPAGLPVLAGGLVAVLWGWLSPGGGTPPSGDFDFAPLPDLEPPR